MTNFQILREFSKAFDKALDEGVDTGVAAKECEDKLREHGHILPIGHHGPIKMH